MSPQMINRIYLYTLQGLPGPCGIFIIGQVPGQEWAGVGSYRTMAVLATYPQGGGLRRD